MRAVLEEMEEGRVAWTQEQEYRCSGVVDEPVCLWSSVLVGGGRLARAVLTYLMTSLRVCAGGRGGVRHTVQRVALWGMSRVAEAEARD